MEVLEVYSENGIFVVVEKDKLHVVDKYRRTATTFNIVENPPVGYVVWNIGRHMPSDYTPYVMIDGDMRVLFYKHLYAVKNG